VSPMRSFHDFLTFLLSIHGNLIFGLQMDTLRLSNADLNRSNIGKKPKIQPERSKDKFFTKAKSRGEPYKGRNENFNPGLLPPLDASCNYRDIGLFLAQPGLIEPLYF